MRTHGYQSYYEDELLDASPLKLVLMLYRGALDAIASARRHLRQGDIRARSRAISKSMAIVTKLSLSLDARIGGDLSSNLAALYGYVIRLLMQANFEQREKPLEEAEQLLSTLLEGWTDCLAEEIASRRAEREQCIARDAPEPVSCAY